MRALPGAAANAAEFNDRRRLRRSALASLALWSIGLPLLSLLKYEGPRVEPSMNPLFVELQAVEPPPAPPPRPVAAEPERVDIAERPRDAAPAPTPSEARPAAATRQSSEAPAAARAAANLRPDPSAAPVATGSRAASPYQTRSAADQALSEDELRTKTPPPGPAPSPAPRTASPGNAPAAGSADSAAARADKFSAALGAASSSLAAAPGSGGTSGGTGTAPAGTRSGPRTGGGDLFGGFDFGPGPARELLSSSKVRVPDSALAGLPNELSTKVSFVIEGGGTVLASTIRFDPPLPDKVSSYLRAAFASWLFSFADSDGQVVFRYSIKVR
jgi:hypothetical protein